MTRELALQILQKHLKNPVLLAHSLAVEATMRSLASLFHGDADTWGITGLLHDADYDETKSHPEKHGILLFQLEPNMIPSLIERAIKAHNQEHTRIEPQSPMDWALYCVDELTGIIFSLAHKTKDKKLSSVAEEDVLTALKIDPKKKEPYKEKIVLCEEKLGIPLEKFIQITLTSMQKVHDELGL